MPREARRARDRPVVISRHRRARLAERLAPRIRKCRPLEAETASECRQSSYPTRRLTVTEAEPAGRRRAREAMPSANARAEARQTPIAFMRREIRAVDRNDQPVEAGGRQADVAVRRNQPLVIKAQSDARSPAIAETEFDDSGCDQRFAALQRHVADPAALEDRQAPARTSQDINIAPRAAQVLGRARTRKNRRRRCKRW